MNDKAAALKLKDTHFVNPTGLHDNNHYSTCADLAIIMAYAVKNDFCKKILETKSYTAVCTQSSGRQFNYYFYHTLLVTQFDKLQKTQPSIAVVMSGKTGYTPESGYCLVTYAQNKNGSYIAVTTGAGSYANCIYDYIVIYDEYIA
jgi:D-alanyl-D-alanine carboxypeptidase (penicillin-binding protein 5/6)